LARYEALNIFGQAVLHKSRILHTSTNLNRSAAYRTRNSGANVSALGRELSGAHPMLMSASAHCASHSRRSAFGQLRLLQAPRSLAGLSGMRTELSPVRFS